MLALDFKFGRAMAKVLRQKSFIVMNDFSCCRAFDDFPIQVFVFIDNSLFCHPFVIGFPEVVAYKACLHEDYFSQAWLCSQLLLSSRRVFPAPQQHSC